MEQHTQQTLTKLNKHKKHNSLQQQQPQGQPSKAEQQLYSNTGSTQTLQNPFDGSDSSWSEDDDDYDWSVGAALTLPCQISIFVM